MSRRKSVLLLAAIGVCLALALYLGRKVVAEEAPASEDPQAAATGRAPPPGTQGAAGAPALTQGQGLESSRGQLPAEEGDLVAMLRQRFGERIHRPYVQMKMLEDLMRHFQARNPRGWKEDLLAALKAAFPERYEELAQRLQQWLDYEQWTRENHARLQGLSPEARRAAVWEERNRLFGHDVAKEIWAAELRNQALAEALQSIDARPQAPLTDRLASYKKSLQETYPENTQAYVAAHRQELMNRFLDLSSVQKDLGTMTPEQRSENLRKIREEMGLDSEALQRWDELDRVRDARWETGSQYMSEREALAQQHSGAELEAKLKELRTRYFGEEADSIASEEESGFFRFAQPRKWGRN
jgi:hypothetical protein